MDPHHHLEPQFPSLPSLLENSKKPYLHRDLSWMQFNERVLAEAFDESLSAWDRLKFLAITASNLDEFFMIRYPSILKGAEKIRISVYETTLRFIQRQQEAFEKIAFDLQREGIFFHEEVEKFPESFEKEVWAHLPEVENFGIHSIQSMENLQSAIIFENSKWIKIPRTLNNHLVDWTDDQKMGIYTEKALVHICAKSGLKPLGLIRVTRDGDLSISLDSDDPESIPDVVRKGLKQREKGKAVRLQYWGSFTNEQLKKFTQALRLSYYQVFPVNHSLNYRNLANLKRNPENSHLFPEHPHVLVQSRPDFNFFEVIQKHELLLHHPYDSFQNFIEFIRQACHDPQVISIEQIFYRVDAVSGVKELLIEAAKTKSVKVIIEVRARFDELNNIRLAEELITGGVEVFYGLENYKVHAKIALVTRKEADGKIVGYTHLSTGNYNASTARVYTDLAILTSRPEFGRDARIFFDALFKKSIPTGFKTLVHAPQRLHRKLIELIEFEAAGAEAGESSYIFAKVNSLVDEVVIDKLYRASKAGVKIDLVVRGACALIPGVPGMSENIRVKSVVDKYLEHSRIYSFKYSNVIYLSSADWMPRNFFSRLELAFPVLDPNLKEYIQSIVIPAYLNDSTKSSELTSFGIWKRVNPGNRSDKGSSAPFRCQEYFEMLAERSYKDTPLQDRKLPTLVSK